MHRLKITKTGLTRIQYYNMQCATYRVKKPNVHAQNTTTPLEKKEKYVRTCTYKYKKSYCAAKNILRSPCIG